MSRWSEFLVKTRIDDSVFELSESVDALERQRIEKMRFWCEGVFTDKERVKKVRDKVKRAKMQKPRADVVEDVADAILEELDQITEDLKFAKSRRGKFILFVNDWTQELYKTFRKDSRFDDLIVGVHGDHERIVVTGRVHDARALVAAVQVIAEHDAAAQLEYRVMMEPR